MKRQGQQVTLTDKQFADLIIWIVGIITFFVLLLCLAMWNIDHRLQRHELIVKHMKVMAEKLKP